MSDILDDLSLGLIFDDDCHEFDVLGNNASSLNRHANARDLDLLDRRDELTCAGVFDSRGQVTRVEDICKMLFNVCPDFGEETETLERIGNDLERLSGEILDTISDGHELFGSDIVENLNRLILDLLADAHAGSVRHLDAVNAKPRSGSCKKSTFFSHDLLH